jgi:hypothetical protein
MESSFLPARVQAVLQSCHAPAAPSATCDGGRRSRASKVEPPWAPGAASTLSYASCMFVDHFVALHADVAGKMQRLKRTDPQRAQGDGDVDADKGPRDCPSGEVNK